MSSGNAGRKRSEEHTSELQSRLHLVCRLLLEKKKETIWAVDEGVLALPGSKPPDPIDLLRTPRGPDLHLPRALATVPPLDSDSSTRISGVELIRPQWAAATRDHVPHGPSRGRSRERSQPPLPGHDRRQRHRPAPRCDARRRRRGRNEPFFFF